MGLVRSVVEVKGLTVVGVAMTFDTDGSVGVDKIVRDGKGVVSVLGASVTLPVAELSLVKSVLVVGPGGLVSKLWPEVVMGPVRVGRIVLVGRVSVLGLADGRASIFAFAQSYMSAGME